MDILTAIVLGVVQGITEFLPVSSSGHLILAREIFGFETPDALAVDAVLQLATVLAVGLYFAKDLLQLATSFSRLVSGKFVEERQHALLIALILGTIPAMVLGLFLEHYMETAFRSAALVGVMLLLGSALMYAAEQLGKQNQKLDSTRGIAVGFFQVLALIPGISRSGATISGGLLAGLTRDEAIRFSFLLSFPIILGSGLKKLFDLYHSHELSLLGIPLLLSFAISFAVGLASIHFLIRYLRQHSMNVFILYRVGLALLVFLILYLR